MPGVRGRRADRFVSGLSSAPAGESQGAPQGTHGSVGPPVSAAGGCRAGPRLGHGGGTLVDSVALGHRYRDHEGAHVAGIHGKPHGRRGVAAGCSGTLAGRAILAIAARPRPHAVSQCRRTVGDARHRVRVADSFAGDPGAYQARMVSLEFEHRPAARSNAGRQTFADVRLGPVGRGSGNAGAADRLDSSGQHGARRQAGREDQRGDAGRRVMVGELRGAESHASRGA
jgi:hypothetical protein